MFLKYVSMTFLTILTSISLVARAEEPSHSESDELTRLTKMQNVGSKVLDDASEIGGHWIDTAINSYNELEETPEYKKSVILAQIAYYESLIFDLQSAFYLDELLDISEGCPNGEVVCGEQVTESGAKVLAGVVISGFTYSAAHSTILRSIKPIHNTTGFFQRALRITPINIDRVARNATQPSRSLTPRDVKVGAAKSYAQLKNLGIHASNTLTSAPTKLVSGLFKGIGGTISYVVGVGLRGSTTYLIAYNGYHVFFAEPEEIIEKIESLEGAVEQLYLELDAIDN